jgi:hypothetical protein
VPGIIGYRGDGLTSTDGVDPQTVLTEGTLVVDVNANQTNPNTNTTGGVTEFQIADPVVALQGSATADAPYLQLHIDSTGVADVKISYLLRDIDGSADDAIQPVALQYRVGTTGNFTNVPAAFVADASTGPNLATLTTPVSVTLPSAAGNVPNLQVRIITTNAVGADEWIGVDDIVVQDAAGSPGSLGFSASVYSVNEAAGTASISVNRSGGSNGAVSIRYQTVVGGTATAGVDYTAVDAILDFADGVTTRNFTIPITNDSEAEPTETINLLLSAPTGGAGLGSSTAVLNILDNDASPPSGLVLNEIDVNPPGTDNPFEYAELRGNPGGTLFGVYFVSIEGDGAGAGLADFVLDLSPHALGSNGLLLIKAAVGGFTPLDGATTVVGVPAFDTTGVFENDSNSFLLIFSPTPIAQNTDLDTNNDGFLELPVGAQALDGIGWTDGGISDVVYGAQLTQVTGTPQAATRFPTDLTAFSFDAWYNGGLINDLGNASVNYDPLNASANFPTGGKLTPGGGNFPSGDSTPPTVDAADFVFDAYPTLQTVTLDFSENVQASLVIADDVTLLNLTTATPVASGDIALSYDGGNDVASLTFPNFANGVLPDGNYRLTLAAESVEDAAGNKLVSAYTFDFFVFGGDANRDRSVGISDFSVVGSNFNLPGTFSLGDFNYNGTVEIGDFSILASKYNTSLPAPRLSPMAVSPTDRPLFGATRIGDDVLPA